MKKLTALILALACVPGWINCASKPDGTTDTPELNEIADFRQDQSDEKPVGLSQEELHNSWGESDGMLSGFWGDIYHLPDSYECIILYYDADGIVETIEVDDRNSAE